VSHISDLAYATPNLTLGTANAAGAASTVIRSDATILAFDATVPNVIQPDDAAAAGAATVAARRDHEHGIVAAVAGAIQPDDAAAEGVATSFSRSDHTHSIVAAAPSANSVSLAASSEGASTSFARADHGHNLDESITPTWTGAHIHSIANVSLYSGADLIVYSDAGGSEVARLDGATGNLICGTEIYRTANNSFLALTGGNAAGAGANIELYGGTHATLANDAVYDATEHSFRTQDGVTTYLSMTATSTVFNESGANVDFRVESDTEINALYLDGATGKVGIMTATFSVDGGYAPSLVVANPSDETQQAAIGYDNAGDYGFIYAVDTATVWKDLILQPVAGYVGIGSGATSPAGVLHVDQSAAAGAVPVLVLDQADVSEEMIEFVTTIGVGNAIEAIGAKSLTTTHFIKVTLPGALTRYIPAGTIA
jgi:hypothetical protein